MWYNLHILAVILLIFSKATIGDIVNIIEKSGHYDYHTTYFDPEKALSEYKQSLKYANPRQKLVEKDGKLVIVIEKSTPYAEEELSKGKDELKRGNWERGIHHIKNALKSDPNFTAALYWLGWAYAQKKEYKKALQILKECIEKNKANFRAYRLKAEILINMGKLNEAEDSLINSIIYNRNYPEAWHLLEKLCKIRKYSLYTKPFVPLYSIQRMDNGKIRIYIDQDQAMIWLPYAFTKAVWQYDSKYFKQRTGLKQYRHTPQEEMEAVTNMVWAYNAFLKRGKYPKNPYLERLKKIKENWFTREFVYFEILSPKNPEVLSTLKSKYKKDLMDYIKSFIILKKNLVIP